jgi:hypothetical protein
MRDVDVNEESADILIYSSEVDQISELEVGGECSMRCRGKSKRKSFLVVN